MSTSASIATPRWGDGDSPYVQLNCTLTDDATTYATYSCELYYYSQYAASVSAARSWSATLPDGSTPSGTYAINGVTGWHLIGSWTVSVSKSSSAFNRTIACSMAMNLRWDGEYKGTVDASGTVTISAITRTTPTTPTSVAVARVSDSSQKVTWGGNNTDSGNTAYWSSVTVRRATDGGAETQIATGLANSTVNYTDSTTTAGHGYSYRVVPYNSSGYNTGGSLVTVYTTPTAPTSVVATKTGTSSVSLAVATSTYSVDDLVVQQSTDSGSTWTDTAGSWTGIATGSSSRVLTFVPDEVPAGTVVYRVALTKASGGSTSSTLTSAYTESNSVVTITAPLAPYVAVNPSVVETGGTATVTWTPNHPDSTEQTKAQVEVTDPSGTATVYDIEGGTTSQAVECADSGTYQVRVRTYGLYEDWGEWSSALAWRAAVPPTVNVLTPAYDGETVIGTPYEVTWDASDQTGLSGQTFELLSGGQALMSVPLGADVRGYTLQSSTYQLDNGTEYTVRVTVASGSGLSVSAERTFSTDWEQPAEPEYTVDYDQTQLSAQVSVWFVSEEGKPDATDATVYRVLADGTRTMLESGLANGQSVIDRLPPLNVGYSYLIVAYADTDVSVSVTAPALLDSGGMEAFNFGSAAETCFALGLDASSSATSSHSGETYHFALGADAPNLPYFYGDGDMDVTGSKSYTVTSLDLYAALRAAVRDPSSAVCWYRSAWGDRARVQADWTLGYAAQSYRRWDVSAQLTETVWEEPVNG